MSNTQIINNNSLQSNDNSFINKTVKFLLDRNYEEKLAKDKSFIVKMIVKYFEAVNTVENNFEQYEIGYSAWESDYLLATEEYYPKFLEEWELKNK